jgi:hypothetical protein
MLLSVTLEGELDDPIPWLGNEISLGEYVTGVNPLPVSLTVWGEFPALSVIVRLDEEYCTAVGLNVTFTVQLWPAARDVPQLLVCENGAEV